jgi:hypothetical protein
MAQQTCLGKFKSGSSMLSTIGAAWTADAAADALSHSGSSAVQENRVQCVEYQLSCIPILSGAAWHAAAGDEADALSHSGSSAVAGENRV